MSYRNFSSPSQELMNTMDNINAAHGKICLDDIVTDLESVGYSPTHVQVMKMRRASTHHNEKLLDTKNLLEVI
jgi:hypothetical protein